MDYEEEDESGVRRNKTYEKRRRKMLRKKDLVVVIFTIFVINFCTLNGFAIEQQDYVSAIMEQVKEQGNYSNNEIENAKIINADTFTGINPFSSNREKTVTSLSKYAPLKIIC